VVAPAAALKVAIQPAQRAENSIVAPEFAVPVEDAIYSKYAKQVLE
jgi:hypothetical protein